MRRRPLHVAQVFTFKSLSQIKSLLSHAVICDWPVKIGCSFMGRPTIALAIVGMSENFSVIMTTISIVVVKLNFKIYIYNTIVTSAHESTL